ncbi:MAG: hypothetical protein Q8P18_22340 [Pseudomonadota bacterium]|nr:hypothetical protein [Pseudomonadota bacterium]
MPAVVPSGNESEAVIPHETQVVRPTFTIESGWGPASLSAAVEAGAGAPAEALLVVLRRAWRIAEGRRAAGASVIAPAGHVARAVGTLLVAASTHGLRGAARGAAAGCAPGVARVVDVSLARQVLHAIPGAQPEPSAALPSEGASPPEEQPPSPSQGVPAYGRVAPAHTHDLFPPVRLGGARSTLPPASWWGREAAWGPRLVTDAADAGRDAASAVVAQLWPAAPDIPTRPAPPRPASGKRVWVADDALVDSAWQVLEAELVPGEWAMAPRNAARGAR